jgi:hypothetical protein
VLQSSAGPVVARPVKTVVAVEKALQGMGTLFRKGTRPMRELIVAHLLEETSVASLRVFLRTLHRSGATARADVVVLFPGAESASGDVLAVFHEEEASFQKMLALSDPKSQRRASGWHQTQKSQNFFPSCDHRRELNWIRRHIECNDRAVQLDGVQAGGGGAACAWRRHLGQQAVQRVVLWRQPNMGRLW